MGKLWMVVLALAAGCVAPGGPPFSEDAVRVAPVSGVTWPPARGETSIEVRAVSLDAQGAQREVAEARCSAASTLYTAEFVAPARVLLPDLGTASPAVTVTCRAGDAVGRAQTRPELVGSSGLYGWPAVGISVGTGDNSGVGVGMGWYGGGTGWSRGSPVVRYPSLRVVLE